MVLRWYANFLTKAPWAPIIASIVITGICGGIAFYFKLGEINNFTDYQKGLEPRGTEKNIWSLTGDKLDEMEYALNPYVQKDPIVQGRKKREIDSREVKKEEQFMKNFDPANHWEMGNNNNIFNHDPRKRHKRDAVFPLNTCLNKKIDTKQIRSMVVETTKPGGHLLTPDNLRAICRLEEEYITKYRTVFKSDGCPAHSLPLYIAAINEIPCNLIDNQHIAKFQTLISECASFYIGQQLNEDCDEKRCPSIPTKCVKYNAVYKTLHYLIHRDFPLETDKLTKVMLIIPQKEEAGWGPMMNYYLNYLDGKDIDNGVVRVTGMDLGIKYEIFNVFLFADLPLFGLAAAFILIILLLYLRSFILLFATLFNVIMSFAVSYFLYFYIFQLKFYPFMNIFAGLILIAVGADDVFVLYDIWEVYKHDSKDPEVSVEKIVSKTLSHGALSIFVTSLTTAAAFLANFANKITAIRLFGVFAAVCVLVNFVFMITFVVSIMVILEIVDRKCNGKLRWTTPFVPILKFFQKINRTIYEQYLPRTITTLSPLWVLIFTVVGMAGMIMIFATPTLKLPSSEEFQVLKRSHPFEKYDFEDRYNFRSETAFLDVENLIFIDIMWGLIGQDNGDWLDPENKGTLEFQPNFDMFTYESMIYLRDFCRELMKQDFVSEPQRYVCFLDAVEAAAKKNCSRSEIQVFQGMILNSSCCEAQFPGSRELNKDCVVTLLTNNLIFYTLGSEYFSKHNKVVGLTLFDPNNTVLSFKYIFRTTQPLTKEYRPMKNFYDSMAHYLRPRLEAAPKTLEGGWFSGVYGWIFYMLDLQESVASGALIGIGLSVGVGFIVLVVTSPNVFLNIFAIISIALTIGITVGCLAALGWELNIIESLTITLAVGLSIDFAIHYSVAYRISDAKTRKAKVYSVTSTVGSAVSMGALTTFLAGASIMPGKLLVYNQFGTFLMLVMAASWVFANFFFLSVCSFVGPTGNYGEIFSLFRNKKSNEDKSTSSENRKSKLFQHALPQENLANYLMNLNWKDAPNDRFSNIEHQTMQNNKVLGRSRTSAYMEKDRPYNSLDSREIKHDFVEDRSSNVPYNRLTSKPSVSYNPAEPNTITRIRGKPDGSFMLSGIGLPRFIRGGAYLSVGTPSSVTSSLPPSDSNLSSRYYNGSHQDSIDPENESDFQFSNHSSNLTENTTVSANPSSYKTTITVEETQDTIMLGDDRFIYR